MLNNCDIAILGEWNLLNRHFATEAFYETLFIDIGRSKSITAATVDIGETVKNVHVRDPHSVTPDMWNGSEIWYVDLVGSTRHAARNATTILRFLESIYTKGYNFELNVLAADHICRRLASEFAVKRWIARYHRIPDVVLHDDVPLSPDCTISEIARQALLASVISDDRKTSMSLAIPKNTAISCCSFDYLVAAVSRYRNSGRRSDAVVAPQHTLTVGDFIALSCTSSPFLSISISEMTGHVNTPIEMIFSNNISRACVQLNDDQAPIEGDKVLAATFRNKLSELAHFLAQALVAPRCASTFDQVEVETWDGYRINVYTSGNPDKPPLLLINAYGMPIEFMAPLAEAVKDRFYLVTWDSRWLPSIWTTETSHDLSPSAHVRDAFHIIELLSLKTPDVIGWCTGAHVALKMALANPDRIGKLVLLNGGYNFKNIADTAFQSNMRHVMLSAAQNMGLAKLYHRALYVRSDNLPAGSNADASLRTTQIFDSTDTSLVNLTGLPYQSPENLFRYASLIASFVKDDDYSGVDFLNNSTLIVTAKDDYTTGYLGSVYLSNRIRHSQIHFHPCGDHFLLYKEVDYLASLLLEFL